MSSLQSLLILRRKTVSCVCAWRRWHCLPGVPLTPGSTAACTVGQADQVLKRRGYVGVLGQQPQIERRQILLIPRQGTTPPARSATSEIQRFTSSLSR